MKEMNEEDLIDGIENKTPEIGQNMIDLARRVIELRERHARLLKETAEIWHEKERLEAELIEGMEVLDLKNFRHKELGLISVGKKIWGRLIDVEKAREYFDREGITDALLEIRLKKDGGQKRLNEIIRECLENGKIIPSGLDYSSKSVIRRSQA